jgi:hypothetical protein
LSQIKGQCGLCLKKRDLADSHLIPKSIYKTIVQESVKLNNPILIIGKKKLATSEQVKAHFLCGECVKSGTSIRN